MGALWRPVQGVNQSADKLQHEPAVCWEQWLGNASQVGGWLAWRLQPRVGVPALTAWLIYWLMTMCKECK